MTHGIGPAASAAPSCGQPKPATAPVHKRHRRAPLRRLARRAYAFFLRAQGFSGRAARTWARRVDAERHAENGFSARRRRAALALGFMPREVVNFRVTQTSALKMLSERDYLYLHPLNGPYDKWLRDRICARTVLDPFADSFEACHFHIIRRAGEPFLIPLSEQARMVAPDAAGLREFLLGHGPCAVASAAWSRTERWSIAADPHAEGGFLLDGVHLSRADLDAWMSIVTRRRALVLIDPAPAEGPLSPLAPQADVTLHVRMMNPDGTEPHVGQAFLEVRCPPLPEEEAADTRRGGHAPAQMETPEEPDADDAVEDDRNLEDGSSEEPPEAADARSFGPASEDVLLLARPRRDGAARSLFARVDGGGAFWRLEALCEDGTLCNLSRAPGADMPFRGSIACWDAVCSHLCGLCRFVPQIEFAEFTLRICDCSFTIVGVDPFPPYNRVVPFSPELATFLNAKAHAKHEAWRSRTGRFKRLRHNTVLKLRRTWARLAAPKGLVPYQSTRWPHDVWADLSSRNGLGLRTKLWAYSHGFLSYRLTQYGITRHNRTRFISDFEYRWIRHVNSKYKYWLEDKVTLKYIAAEFDECFPAYYYCTCFRNGQQRIVPMMDLPAGFGADAQEVLRLARSLGSLALKPDEGSHGAGFYHLSWDGSGFTLNGEPASESRIVGVLEDPANRYVVTEYIRMHPDVARLYPHSVNTVRLIVFKRDGRTPQIGAAYLRIGTQATGTVDNVAAGGIVAEIEVETGRFGNAQMLQDVNCGRLVTCPVHPDTGASLQGVIPHWELAKASVLAIAQAIPQIEYFGFDVAITPSGIKIPEVNRYPDMPRVARLSPQAHEYLLFRLERKKKLYGYDARPCRKPLRLPRR